LMPNLCYYQFWYASEGVFNWDIHANLPGSREFKHDLFNSLIYFKNSSPDRINFLIEYNSFIQRGNNPLVIL
jgi:hypothetical protein